MWEKVWQEWRRWLIKKLVTDPHSAFLHGGLSDGVLQLKFDTTIDGRLFLETEIVHRLVRLMAQIVFRTPEGGWTEPRDALIDTGSTVSVIPPSVWQNTDHTLLAGETEIDIGGITASGRPGLVNLRLQDEQAISPTLRVKADLIEEDSLPLILGFEDVLTEVILVSDFHADLAYVVFRH